MKMKFLKIVSMVLMILFIMQSHIYSAFQDKMTFELTANIENIDLREIYINLKINIPQNMGTKINTYKAKINYDKNVFEELNIHSFENLSGWENLQYNKENSEIIATKKEGMKNSEEVVKIRLKVKENLKENTTSTISVSNVQLPNSTENEIMILENKEGSQEEKINITITVENNSPNNAQTENDSENKEENNSNNQNNGETENLIPDEKLPNLGEPILVEKIIIAIIILITLLLIIKYIKYKKIIASILIALVVTHYSLSFVLAMVGDINRDNTILLNDIITLEKHLIREKQIEDKNGLDNADINQDGKINLVDLSLLLDLYYYPKQEEDENEAKVIKLETESLGMGGYGMLFSPKISPFDSNTMACLCDMGGIYISHNKGETWERKELRGAPYTIYFDPNTEGVIYTGGSGLYRSTDNGETFEMIFPREDQLIKSINRFENIQRLLYPEIDYKPSKYVQAVAVEPGNSNHIVVILHNNGNGFIYESTDNGENFKEIASFIKNKDSDSIYYDNMQLFFTNGKIRYMIQDGIYEYIGNGQVKEIYQSETMIDDLEIIEENGETYYILLEENHNGYVKSKLRYTKDFKEFTDLTQKLEEDIKTSYINWEKKEVFYDIDLRHVVATSLDHMYFTQDGYCDYNGMELGGIIRYDGNTFDWLFGYHFRGTEYIENSAFTDNIYKMYGIDVDKNSENSVLYTTLCGIYYSPDSDKIYQKYTKIVKDESGTRYSSTGLDVQTTYSVKQDPFDKNHLLLPSTDLGLIGSQDNGETWVELKEGIPKKWRNTVYDVEFDKTKQGTVYSVWSSRHDIPYTTVGDEYDATVGGFAISFDGGNTWDSEYSTGIPQNAIPNKIKIVYGEEDTKTIYVATFNEGFFVSYDSGKTFQEINDGLEGVDYEGHHFLYATDIECEEGRIFGIIARSTLNNEESPGKVYEYVDKKWQEIKLPEEVICPRDVYYHNGTLYISSTADIKWDDSIEGVDYKNIGGGILAYKDGVMTRIYDESSSIAAVQIDSKGNLYANDIFGNIYLKNQNYDFEKIYSDYHWISKGIILQDDETMYLPTFGGGLLRIKISYENNKN